MNEKLQLQLETAIHNIESRTPSEKIIVLVVLIAGILLMYLSLVFDPLSAEISQLNSQAGNVERQIAAQQATYASMLVASEEDPSRFANDRISAIERELQALDGEINNLAGDLVTPSQMTAILTTVLGQYSGLKLKRFQNTPATPLRTGLGAVNGDAETSDLNGAIGVANIEGQVFEHGLMLEFEGDFFTTLKYLRFLEDITGSFFWDSISYKQLDWPNANVTLEIHTLSTNEGFIGV